ncbi:MAG: hypothetical protein COX19_02540, partial [Desulfobacterales bacterium CG23_combo_of_CG06-09_8_20_14_all_51_8]
RLVELGKPGKKIFRVITSNRAAENLSDKRVIIDISPVNGRTIYDDLAKRDFTINAMAIATDSGRLIDHHQGMEDLSRKTIRMIARENFCADPLRLLRAYRFAAVLNFAMDDDTSRAIRTEAFRVHEAAAERIRDELFKLLTTPRACWAMGMMTDTGLLDEIFPELAPLKHCSQNAYHQFDAFEHSMKAFDFLEKLLHGPESPPPGTEKIKPFLPLAAHFPLLKFSILLHDIGKPAARSTDEKGRIHFYGHEQPSADMAKAITRRLRFSNHDLAYVDFIIRNHIRPLSLFIADSRQRLPRKALARFFLQSGSLTRDLLVHTMADIHGKGIPENTRTFTEFIHKILVMHSDSFLPRKSSPPLITGNDLIQVFKLKPSPQFAKILASIEEERLSGTIHTRAQALDQVKKIFHPEHRS